MSTITTRSGKGSPLTNNEVDANFTNLNTDKLELSGGTLTGNLNLGDNVKAQFGASNDLQIFHTGSYSAIKDVGTGALFIGGDNYVDIGNSGLSQTRARFYDGTVQLHSGGEIKLATTSTGIDVSGTATMDGLTVDGESDLNATITITHANPRIKFIENNTTNANTQFSNDGGDFAISTMNDAESTFTKRFNLDHATGDISFYEDTGTTPKLVWDASAESLGIGTDPSSYSNTLVADQGGNYTGLHDQAAILVRASTGTAGVGNHQGAISFSKGTGQAAISGVQEGSDTDVLGLAFWTHGSGTGSAAAVERLRIDNQGRVGIGVSSGLSNKLSVNGDQVLLANGELKFADAGNNAVGSIKNSGSAGTAQLEFLTNNVERMRLNADGSSVFSGSVTADGLTVDGVSALNGNTTISGTLAHSSSGGLTVKIGLNNASISSSTDCYIGTHTSGGMGSTSGDMVLIPRSNANSAVQIVTGNGTPTKTATFSHNGDISFYNDSAAQAFFFDSSTSQLFLGATSASALNTFGDDLVVVNTAAGTGAGISIIANATNGYSNLYFGDTADGDVGRVQYNHSDNSLTFRTNTQNALVIDSSQNATFSGSVTAPTLQTSSGNIVITGQEIYSNSEYSGNDGAVRINRFGYQGGQTKFRDVNIYDGKGTSILTVDGSTGNTNIPNGSLMVGSTAAPASTLEVAKNDQTNGATLSITNSYDGSNWDAGDTIGTVDFRVSDLSTTQPVRGQIKVFSDIGSGSNTFPYANAMSFSTGYQNTLDERFRIDSAGLVSIKNTTAPTLRIENTDTGLTANETIGDIDFYQNDASGGGVGVVGKIRSINDSGFQGEASLAFHTGTTGGLTERFRISSDGSCRWTPDGTNHDMTLTASGNLLVGKTSADLGTTAGIELNGQYDVGYFTRHSEKALVVSRLTNDGTLMDFRRDNNATVGTIGTFGGQLNIGLNTTSGLNFGSSIIYPRGTGNTTQNGTIDLGNSGNRFKNLYLSANASFSAHLSPHGDNAYVNMLGSNRIQFTTNGQEAARIDASQNLLVGGTDSRPAEFNHPKGISFRGDIGQIQASTDGNIPLLLNRDTSDGDMIYMLREGTTVGSIGTVAGDIVIGTGACGIRFHNGTPAIQPRNSNGNANNDAIDIGLAGNRFKDLYLSGGVYLGGTGAANKLDDYEEGTWTPIIKDGTTSGATLGISVSRAHYTKVGRMCTITAHIGRADATALTQNMIITNLPFTQDGGPQTGGVIWVDNFAADQLGMCYANDGTVLYFRSFSNTNAYILTNQFENGRALYFSRTYETT